MSACCVSPLLFWQEYQNKEVLYVCEFCLAFFG